MKCEKIIGDFPTELLLHLTNFASSTRGMNMNAEAQLEQSVQEEETRTALKRYWQVLATGDVKR
jgi:hypothetical protein